MVLGVDLWLENVLAMGGNHGTPANTQKESPIAIGGQSK
jgi:hypothetical protein